MQTFVQALISYMYHLSLLYNTIYESSYPDIVMAMLHMCLWIRSFYCQVYPNRCGKFNWQNYWCYQESRGRFQQAWIIHRNANDRIFVVHVYRCTCYLFYTDEEESIQVFVFCYTCVCNCICDNKHVSINVYTKLEKRETMKTLKTCVGLWYLYLSLPSATFNLSRLTHLIRKKSRQLQGNDHWNPVRVMFPKTLTPKASIRDYGQKSTI